MPIFPSFFVNKDAAAYEIEQSLRYSTADNEQISRQLSTDGNRKTWTFSAWLKRADGDGDFTDYGYLFAGYAGTNDSTYSSIVIDHSTQKLKVTGFNTIYFTSNMVFRDLTAWYHIVVACDTTQSTASNRLKVYVNGSQISGTTNDLTQNQDTGVHAGGTSSGYGQYVGSEVNNLHGNHYLAEVHLIDGSQKAATDFGEINADGVWRPKNYSGSHGTQGVYLKFDPSATNGVGHDHSSNSNNYTATNVTTSGTETDVMSDTPTKNWCTLNPLSLRTSYNNDCNEGNLGIEAVGGDWDRGIKGTIGVSSGKWYWEYTHGTIASGYPTADIGITKYENEIKASTSGGSASADTYLIQGNNGNKYNNGSGSSYGSAFTTGDVCSVALDLDNGKVWFGKNGTYFNSGSPSAGTNAAFTGLNGTFWPLFYWGLSAGTSGVNQAYFNFGQREFANPPGTIGATDYFNTVTYTANNQSTKAVTGVGFQPDMVWLKTRSRDEHHYIYDVVRGVGNRISPSQTIAETTGDNTFTSFDSDGFTLGADGAGIANYQTDSMVAWCFKAGGTASDNTDGSQTASVSANDAAGFSIMKWNYSGSSSYTVGHGLSTAPKLLLLKKTGASTNWFVRHGSIHTGNGALFLNSSSNGDSSSTAFSGTAPTDSVITVNGALADLQGANVCYAFAEKTGVSKFGSYDGNGSSDGPVISCGFRPAMVLIKWYEGANTAESWQLYDNKRAGNPTNTILQPDSNADDESPSDRYIQFNADGFQLKSNGQQINRSGAKYIFAAWAATFTGNDFKSLNTANLAAPDIKDGSDYFNTVLYTGDGSNSHAITGVGFQPSLVWGKCRNATTDHYWVDAVRGATKTLRSNTTAVEYTQADGLVSFDSDGFTLDDDNSGGPAGNFNINTRTYVAWAWDAGTSNTSVSIGSLNTTSYNISSQSTTWSSLGTGDNNSPYNWEATFDGNSSTYGAIPLVGSAAVVDFSSLSGGGISYTSSVKVTYNRNTSAPDVTVNGTAIGATADGTDRTYTLSGSGTLTSVGTATRTVASSGDCAIKKIVVDGQELVDYGFTATVDFPSIATTVRANPTAGFSIVSYTGTGTAGTVAHGLNVPCDLIIEKNRDRDQNWVVYHSALGAEKALILDDNLSQQDATYYWNDTEPTNTVFSVGTWNGVNSNTEKHIAYCFAEVEGYSKFGLIKGNYIDEGPCVYLGFTPAFLMFKNAERGTTDWVMIDVARDTYNYAGRTLRANTNAVEDTLAEQLDILSNGFKLRTRDLSYNGPDDNPGILYAAFASNPFGGDGVSPATAR